jgi:hypothetical protein
LDKETQPDEEAWQRWRWFYYGHAHVDREIEAFLQIETLARLRHCVEAMQCELVYALRPRCRITFGRVIAEILWSAIRNQPFGDGPERPRRIARKCGT